MKFISMFLITALSYMLIPILVILINKKWSKKKRMYFVIIFCIAVSLIYQIIGYYSYEHYKINFMPAYFYGSILVVFNSFIEENDEEVKKQHIDKQHIKKLKQKKSFLVILSIIIILNVLLFSYSVFLLNSNKKLKKENKEININQKKHEKKDNIELEIDSNNNDKTCTYYPIDGTYYITISAESSVGVGDVFSKMDSNLVYRIHDNKYGETYISKRKYQGDPNIYECDEVWYEIYLQNGKHGFIGAGYNGMYVKEQ